ncbi:Not1-domain-containing protein [Mollisia scopiformis]|uniref:General negative regulator of transcription subunit 1 n=1 Tax=Mollisia scopiformis TaxID=149040 RepID=A0A194XL46_MOLSC|nr:Not1-domain-containing protein [Mollisia scopiformis]KUJ20497.1 Not1-domain-containing protein [Mollisia scopiformis]
MVPSKGGTFTPSPAQQRIETGISHSPHGSHHGPFSAGASPSTSSPTGSNVTKIVVAQVYLLLSTIKEDKDRTKWEQQAEQIRKLVDEHGMDIFPKYFTRLVVGNAPQIFPGSNRGPIGNGGNYEILVREVRKIRQDVEQARRIAESIETANEDLFRDFDLSTFMEHFKLDALEKTVLALAFKIGPRSDLKTKADAILSTNYTPFLQILAQPLEDDVLSDEFVATIVDRFIQYHPPNFDQQAKKDLETAISYRYVGLDRAPPAIVLSALYLRSLLDGSNPFASYIQQVGNGFTADEETCKTHLQNLPGIQITEKFASSALLYTAISRTPVFSPSVLANTLRMSAPNLRWSSIIDYFDIPDLRISREQLLAIYEALLPLAVDGALDVQQLWGGQWTNPETQLSFINAFTSLTSDLLDASTIPNLQPAFTVAEFSHAEPEIQERAAQAARHPLVSVVALSAMFNVALDSPTASDSPEAKRLFQDVVVPNLDIFLVAAFGVPKPWPDLASDTITNLFERFLYKFDPNYNFVLEGLWIKDQPWVFGRLTDTHAKSPSDLTIIMDHAVRHNWIDQLVSQPTGFSMDLASVACGRGLVDLEDWAQKQAAIRADFVESLLTFLSIKAQHELDLQRQGELRSVALTVKAVWQLLHIVEDLLPKPKTPSHDLIVVQRTCITAYPRLINYDQGFDDIIDANGANGNSLPKESVAQMEEHYKRMYSDEVQVRTVVEALNQYKHSRGPAEQDVFACMIHGLFDEYALYHTYPLEALATTAVLFGGIISHRLIDDLPLQIGLGMILEAVRDYTPTQSMYKFGLQALMQLFPRLREWPGFCMQLLQIPGLQNTEAWAKAKEAAQYQQELDRNAPPGINGGLGAITNGDLDDMPIPALPAFASLHVEDPQYEYEDPDEDMQDKIQFVLNNITAENLDSKFLELKDVVTEQNLQWFAGHLVQERAKMQPNFHELYLNLVRLFSKKSLWAELLRETYLCAFRTLNSEATLNSTHERQFLKNLATWLGALTLARDKPIKHKNIAFKQLLAEGLDSQRLIVVIPFVCKLLVQGQYSTIFKPPNPWIMDIIKALMELYHKADLKLNMKFEIEVLCADLGLDHKTIEPSDEIMNRIPDIDPGEVMAPEGLDRFDNLSLNGMAGGVGGGRFSPQEITSSIPDLGPLLNYPPTNDMVNQGRLQEIVRTAITRAVHEIISPVVERSVTIAAISTAQMIHKDFATESSETRLRSAAINMVKKTAGALALVTSKEPLRASMTNYIRGMSGELAQGLPEGTIIMCVNSNLDLACSQVEKKAEERAVPEIEDMIEPELEARRLHRLNRPEEPYVDPNLNRWSWTIPPPYKLQPSMAGLNQEQMAIYDEFARQPRIPASLGSTTHVPSTSDATRSMANDILQDQYPAVPNLPTPAEPPAMPHIGTQQPAYAQHNTIMANGRMPSLQVGPASVIERLQRTLAELERAVQDSPEQHFRSLRQPHPVLDAFDTVMTLVIRSCQTDALDVPIVPIVDFISKSLFGGSEHDLLVESLVLVLRNICRLSIRASQLVHNTVENQAGDALLHVPLAVTLVENEMVDWQRIDQETTKAIKQHKEEAIQFLSALLDAVLLNDRPVALYADFASSLEAAWKWIEEDPSLEIGQQLKEKLISSGLPQAQNAGSNDERITFVREQMGYVFEEWVRLCNNPNASDKASLEFISQMYNRQVINNRDDLCLFLRLSIESSIDRFEQHIQHNGSINDAYIPIDSLAKLIAMLVKGREQEGEVKADKAAYLKSISSLVVLILNHHHVTRGELFNQKVFFRLLSTMLCEFSMSADHFSDSENQDIMLVFAHVFLQTRPAYFPGFLFGWLSLVSHRNFLPVLLRLPDQLGWGPCAELVEGLTSFTGNLLKPLQIQGHTKEVYRGVLKFLLMLQHDFPDFLAANHSQLGNNIPNHCVQLHNLILTANPASYKMPDPLQPGLKIDRVEEIRVSPANMNDVEIPLRQTGLFDVINQAFETGASEHAVAQIAHAIQRRKTRQSGLGFVPISVDLNLMEALVVYIGVQSIARAEQKGAPTFVPGSPDAVLLSMLVHELNPEARYFLISSIINQLRFPSTHTHYFSQALLGFFGSDVNDPEELDIRQQVTRILLERLLGQWPHPWGLIVTVQELVKNDQLMFFELPFIKSSPDIQERFMALASRG